MSCRVALVCLVLLAASGSLAQQPVWPNHPSAPRAQQLSQLIQESLQRQAYGQVVAAANELAAICADELADAPAYEAMAENYKGVGLAYLGEHQDAMHAFVRSAELYEAALPGDSPHLQTVFDSARQAAVVAGDFDVAWRFEEKANTMFEAYADDTAYDARLLESAESWAALRQVDAALALARRRTTRVAARHGEGSAKALEAARFVGYVAQRADAFELAVEEMTELLPRARALRAQHPDLCASVLNELGQALAELARWPEAAPLFDEALGGLSNSEPSFFDTLATLHNNRGLNRKALGDVEGAADDFTRAVFYRRQLDDGQRLAYPLNNRGNLYREMGLLDAATRDLEEAYRLRRALEGEVASTTATTQLNLGLVAVQRGDFVEGERRLQASIDAYRGALGEQHPKTAHAQVTLADVLAVRGATDRAEALYAAARPALMTLPPGHAARQAFLHTLVLQQAAGEDLAGAMDSAAQLERDYAATGRTETVEYAGTLLLMADLDYAMGNKARARRRASRASALLRQSQAADGGYAIDVDLMRAAWEVDADHLDKALRHIDHARSLVEGREGFNSRRTTVLWTQAVLQWRSGDEDRAVVTLRAAKRDVDRWLQRWLLSGSLQERAKMTEVYCALSDLGLAFLFTSEDDKRRRAIGRLVVEIEAARRGAAVLASVQRYQALRASPQARDKLNALTTLRQRLSAISLQGGARTRRAALERQLGELERELAVMKGGSALAQLAPTYEALTAALPPDALYVAYFIVDAGVGERALYALAFNHAGQLAFFELAAMAAVASDIAELRRLMVGASRRLPQLRAVAARLHATLISPVRELLGGDKTLVLSPSGALHLLPWGALVDSEGRWLAESTTVVTTLGPRGLLEAPSAPSGKPLVVASPTFGAPGAGALQQWAPLPATRAEAEAVAALLGEAELAVGAEAHEGRLLGARSPRVLHIATHGYFFEAPQPAPAASPLDPDEGRTLLASARGFRVIGPRVRLPKAPVAARPRPTLEGDALVRSGLALAGANSGAAVGDGFLTGLEASGLDLSGTELVVLSACETGVGDTGDGDALGVAGLQRAFAIAGARSQVTSLWSVDDRATRDLMTRFYEGLIQQGLPRGEALRRAQIEVMGAEGHAHPYYWAAFVLSGDLRPLSPPAAP